MKEDNVRIFIPFIWSLFKRYLNDPGYYVRSTDILASKFMTGEAGVKEFIKELNKKAKSEGLTSEFKYKKGLTYSKILLMI